MKVSDVARSPRATAKPAAHSETGRQADAGVPFPSRRFPTALETIREDDETAQAQAELEFAAAAPAAPSDFARPAGGKRLRVRWRGRAVLGLVGADAAAGMGAALIAVLVWADRAPGLPVPVLVSTAIAAAVGWTIALTLAGVHGHRLSGHGVAEFKRIAMVTVTAFAALAGTALILPATLALKYLALVGVPLAFASSICAHAGARLVLRQMRARGRCVYRVVAVGTERSVAELVRATRRDRASGLSVVGLCLNKSTQDEVEGVPVVGTPDNAVSAVRWLGADTILITSWSDVGQEDLRRLSWEVEGSGVQLLVAPRLSGVAVPRLQLRTVDGSPLVQVAEQEFTGARRIAKSALDYGLSIFITLMVSPLLVAVALAVKLTSPGPVMFRQERVGRHGELFTMHKFRSMYVNAEAQQAQLAEVVDEDRGPMFKLVDDPRVTGVGRFIRRFSLDELPQLLDVVRGRMSLVGPRPPVPAEVAQYEDDVRRRLRVKPGMTGLWQVSGRSNLSWEDTVRLDLHYVENWSLTTDLSIMCRTVSAVLARKGAY